MEVIDLAVEMEDGGEIPYQVKKPSLKLDDPVKEAKREANFIDSFAYSHKQRFGLFSQPHSNACGDTNYIRKTRSKKNEDGEVEIGPRNFYGGPLKFGAHERVHFPGFITNVTGDPYKKPPMPGRRTMIKDGHLKSGHEKAFVTAKNVTHKKQNHSSSFLYMENGPKPRKNYISDDREVIIGPVNFLTMPMKQGRVQRRDQVEFGGPLPYKEDDYNIKKRLQTMERKQHQEKINQLQEGKAFYSTTMPPKHKNGNFNRPETVFGNDRPLPEPKNLRPASAAIMDKRVKHDIPFRPNGCRMKPQAFHPTIGRYPEWTGGRPMTAKVRKVLPPELAERPSFKMTHNAKSTPSASIALNVRNLRAQSAKGPRR